MTEQSPKSTSLPTTTRSNHAFNCPDCWYGNYDLCGHSPPVSEENAHEILDTGGLASVTNTPPKNKSKETTLDGNSLRFSKEDSEVKDPHSTGRKRAAVLYPIEDGAKCEWRRLAYAGGGKRPIVGCVEGLQENRHHGPDKNTLNNAEGNVHRICAGCHNLWHHLNDEDYHPQLGHKPRVATDEELVKWNVFKDYSYE